MKVKVFYHEYKSLVLEVDDKFLEITTSGGYDYLSSESQEQILNDLESEVLNKIKSDIDVDAVEIDTVWEVDEKELLFKN